ncbi:response regulator [Sphaerisporangium fuscum]|uniref:response regulator n=1 Tax=Sphaerisporangium fuscum TaxID=2835868 RepID=UPI001BDD4BF5|nr:response regulator transcription factor [Sphaerisporangium fuscum]
MIRLIVVDDQALVREGLALILGARPEIEVIAQLPDGPALLDFADRLEEPADVILLDLYLPGADGVETLRSLRARHPRLGTRVLMLTTVGRAADVHRALAAGADGFVLKDAGGAELAAAVLGAHSGVTALSSSVTEILWPREAPSAGGAPRSSRIEALTRRASEILALVARGMANQEIARALGLAERTVKTHVSNILGKRPF